MGHRPEEGPPLESRSLAEAPGLWSLVRAVGAETPCGVGLQGLITRQGFEEFLRKDSSSGHLVHPDLSATVFAGSRCEWSSVFRELPVHCCSAPRFWKAALCGLSPDPSVVAEGTDLGADVV